VAKVGAVNLDWKGDQATREMANAGYEAIKASAEELLKASQILCPKERGFDGGLVSTSRVETNDGLQEANVVYGNATGFPYGPLQHEKMTFKHENGESAKYVEKPMNANAQRYLSDVADEIKKVVGD
jgi:hypothetical protein